VAAITGDNTVLAGEVAASPDIAHDPRSYRIPWLLYSPVSF